MTRNVKSHEKRPGVGGCVIGYNDRLIDLFAVLRPQPAPAREAPEDLSWQDRGRCAETFPDAFFPEKGGSTREAKAVCRSCEVRESCLQYALEHDERFGIWGGMSERERRRLKRQSGASLKDGIAVTDADWDATQARYREAGLMGAAASARSREAARELETSTITQLREHAA